MVLNFSYLVWIFIRGDIVLVHFYTYDFRAATRKGIIGESCHEPPPEYHIYYR